MAGFYVGGTEMSRSSSDSSLPDDIYCQHRRHFSTRKRRLSYPELSDLQGTFGMFPPIKRHRLTAYPDALQNMDYGRSLTPAFFIIKEANTGRDSPGVDQIISQNPATLSYSAEAAARHDTSFEHLKVRTSDPHDINYSTHTKDNDHDDAARLVEADLLDGRRRSRLSQHERILRSLISPKSRDAEFDIDDVALQGIFSAANEIFFRGRLKGRVIWAWKDLSSSLVGTTALRKSPLTEGYETMIYLSRRILKDRKYNRRLLISTFIHELIHSYLFIVCGFQSGECGGHTNGFRRIAHLIDDWAGPGLLHLCNMEAELSDFEVEAAAATFSMEQVFDDGNWGAGDWPHSRRPDEYVLLDHPQCYLRPVIRSLGRDFL
ncbi:hypothetical protein F4779DRAFT_463387 [Xylariaceae sp. FL0662B]|nr:hypothetical protein F4779DRAFT_463387 [Xylariaceae sp. FL0662B]